MQLLVLSTLVALATAAYGPGAVEKTTVADYSYGTVVSDPASGVHNTKEETRLGDRTEGSYSTVLPDGRRQIVTYWVDGDSGYNAKVTYEGVAHHPEPEVVKATSQPPVLPQYDPPAALDLNDVLVPPTQDAFIQSPDVRFIPDTVDLQAGVSPSVPFTDVPFVTDERIVNEQHVLNNLDLVNNQRRFLANTASARTTFASDYPYAPLDLATPALVGANFGQNAQAFRGVLGVDARSPVFNGRRGGLGEVGFNRFAAQLRHGAGRRSFASVNGFQAAGPVNGYRVRDANNFRRNVFNTPRQNYGYQGYSI